eukprot:CAMPEP_0175920286 /NCGR_PEP_ID=MMETSP0108-20121206/12849_1 /TAXON_ID=195067 ORGANISM="Goniomonas pacifica, Strain CCMP1869" /NCGR_SAMPLE_ID=MMETSP0108 /ASSEMBLY_ACC=CAM_ASM_000204 /LENGTH=125 /DNA_ID=CAMNT_0017242995 /DNA_START=21 /DNA_END=398 /DNA_ORIENTATION=-
MLRAAPTAMELGLARSGAEGIQRGWLLEDLEESVAEESGFLDGRQPPIFGCIWQHLPGVRGEPHHHRGRPKLVRARQRVDCAVLVFLKEWCVHALQQLGVHMLPLFAEVGWGHIQQRVCKLMDKS